MDLESKDRRKVPIPQTSPHDIPPRVENCSSPLRNSHGGGARAVVTLNSKNLVIERSKLQANIAPSVEVSTGVDRAAGTLVAADRPVLLESAGTLNGGSVGAGAGVDVVDGAVDVDLSLLGGARRGVVGSKVLDDVVLDQRVAGPAVDGEVAVAVGLVGARVLDSSRAGVSIRRHATLIEFLPSSTGVPTLAANKVALVTAPGNAELTSVLVGVGDSVGVISPEGVVVSAVVAGGALSALGEGRVLRGLGRGDGENTGEGRHSCEEVAERNHFDLW